MTRWRTLLIQTAYFIGLFIAWEAFVQVAAIRPYLLPSPISVGQQILTAFPNLTSHALVTLEESLYGFGLAALVGLVMASLITWSKTLRSLLMPTLVAFNAIPKVAFAPLLVLWLGLGIDSKVAMAFLISFFPIVVNTTTGMTEIEPELLNVLRLMRASEVQIFTKVRIPHALPGLFDGLKIALPLAIIGALVGEFIAAKAGLGYLMILAGISLNTKLTFAAVIFIAVISVLLYQALVVAESLLLRWRPSARGGQ